MNSVTLIDFLYHLSLLIVFFSEITSAASNLISSCFRVLISSPSCTKSSPVLTSTFANDHILCSLWGDESIRKEASDYVSLMTPVVKTMFTDLGMEITSDAMQIFGGYGYTKDQGIEQLYRDNRITPIYEGTNSVQALDLVFRKLVNKNGDVIDKYLNMIKNDFNKSQEKIKPFIDEFNNSLDILNKFTVWIKDKLNNSKDDASAACNDYLKALGFVSIAHSWIKVLEICYNDYENNKSFYEDKVQTAKFYFKRVLPRVENHFKTAITGSDYIMNFKFN